MRRLTPTTRSPPPSSASSSSPRGRAPRYAGELRRHPPTISAGLNRSASRCDQWSGTRGTIMADRKSLGILGFILGVVTSAVILAGGVVRSQRDGQAAVGVARVLVSASLVTVVR